MFVYGELQLSLGGADGLVDALLAQRRARSRRRTRPGACSRCKGAPPPLVRRVLRRGRALRRRLCLDDDGEVGLVDWAPPAETPLEEPASDVVDLETTGVGRRGAHRRDRRGADRAARAASRRSSASSTRASRCLRAIVALTGIRERDLTGAGPGRPGARASCSRLRRGCMLVAHNARFDVGMLDRALMRARRAPPRLPVLDTVALARRLLAGPRGALRPRQRLAERFSLPTRPCHRALPDAQATAEVLLLLIGLAQERGARDRRGRARPRRWRRRGAAQARRRHAVAGCRPGRACTSCATRTGRRCTSARRAICARGCARTSARAGRSRRSRRRSERSPASTPCRSAASSRPRSSSSS